MRIVAMLFAASGGVVETVPRRVHLFILSVLRPAESAVRRLVFYKAQGLSVPPLPKRKVGSARGKRAKGQRSASFPLFDPRKRFDEITPRRRTAPGHGPRIFGFDGFDPVIEPDPTPPSPDDLVDAGQMCRRLRALQRVLEDIPKYALRLARWRAREPEKARRWLPMRPGRPPGHRTRHIHPVDEILAECHLIAQHAMRPPDT